MEIQINGTKIIMECCDHCFVEPTEVDALKAISLYKSIMGESLCCLCGKIVSPTVYELIHQVVEKPGAVWYAHPVESAEALWIRSQASGVRAGALIHRECAIRHMPFLPKEVLAASDRAVWPSIEVDLSK